MTPADIRASLLSSRIFFPPAFGGAVYALPTVAWLQGAFTDYFKQELFNADMQTWAVRWECRDFSRAFACLAQVCNARSNTPGNADALAVGEVWFIPDADRYGTNPGQLGGTPGGGHAINAAFTEQGLIFLDPQFTSQLWPMSLTELSSIYFLRF